MSLKIEEEKWIILLGGNCTTVDTKVVNLDNGGNSNDEKDFCCAKKHSVCNMIMSIDVCNRWPPYSVKADFFFINGNHD